MPLPQQPPPPPQHPSSSTAHQAQHLPKPTTLPDFLLTAFSLFILFVGPKHHHHTPKSHSLSYPSQPTNRRCFLRPSTTAMSQNSNPSPNFTNAAHPFPNPQSLSDWLKPRLPSDSLASWGTKPGTKNVNNLWLEIAEGETSLVDTSPPVRNLEVLSIRIIGNNNKILVEWHQELSDGSIRKRGRPLSEKLKFGEDIESAVKRAITEELGSIIYKLNGTKDVDFGKIVRIVPNSYDRKVEERVSLSYPGLPGCYVLHTVDAFVDGLPEGEFVTEEEAEYGDYGDGIISKASTVRKHFWRNKTLRKLLESITLADPWNKKIIEYALQQFRRPQIWHGLEKQGLLTPGCFSVDIDRLDDLLTTTKTLFSFGSFSDNLPCCGEIGLGCFLLLNWASGNWLAIQGYASVSSTGGEL
ncbi:hypothetical protein Nepgr_010663 [Nepenthes gracilis]|uniref:Nudix hydrolase domain-containing protein n=1 Tax=Nepenthes gracilis TaxID=150966 RepID=A0AAD3SCT4_NEPGR|nr:hypothetical protein Nepgr_010663 [Nepenthes gracilis]